MSEPVSALGHARFAGFAAVEEVGPLGMITLRAKPEVKALAKAVKAAVGCALPGPRRIVTAGDKAAGWMSPDEYLLILPYDQVGATLAALERALEGEHHLAANVSDARAVFDITGAKADQVLRKLCPVDLDRLEPGELRRTRAAQAAAAFWAIEGGFRLVTFRSVAGYAMGILSHAAMPGADLG